MGHSRKQLDHQKGKINNLVAKHNNHRGGFHTKSNKACRNKVNADLSQIDPYDEDRWIELEDEWGHL